MMTKSTKMKTNSAARVIISTSKSRFSMISVDESVCRPMPRFMALPSCYLARLNSRQIAATRLPLTNFVLACSCSLEGPEWQRLNLTKGQIIECGTTDAWSLHI